MSKNKRIKNLDILRIRPIEKLALVDQILDQIGKLIIQRSLRPGDSSGT